MKGRLFVTIQINDQELYINKKLYDAAGKAGDFVLNTIKNKTKDNNQTQLFYAIMIYLHVQTGELLKNIDLDDLDILMKAWDVPEPEKTKE